MPVSFPGQDTSSGAHMKDEPRALLGGAAPARLAPLPQLMSTGRRPPESHLVTTHSSRYYVCTLDLYSISLATLGRHVVVAACNVGGRGQRLRWRPCQRQHMNASGTAHIGRFGTSGAPDRRIVDRSKPLGSRNAGRESRTNRHRKTAQCSTTMGQSVGDKAPQWWVSLTALACWCHIVGSSAGVFTVTRFASSFPHAGNTALRVALPA